MKKLIIMVAVLGLSFGAKAQNFDKYQDMAEVDGVFITQHLFKLISKIDIKTEDPEEQQVLELIKNLEGIKVLSTHNGNIGEQMKEDVQKFTSSESLNELMRVKQANKNVVFYSKPGNSDEKVSELFMFMTDKEPDELYVLLSLTGDIDLSKIGQIAGELDGVPGMEELKNVKNK